MKCILNGKEGRFSLKIFISSLIYEIEVGLKLDKNIEDLSKTVIL